MTPAAADKHSAAAPQGDSLPQGQNQTTIRTRTVAILPARLASTRLPRKMLLAETGSPLVVHSARNVLAAKSIERTVIATDSPEILAACQAAGLDVLLTREDHRSGTDRVEEALGQLGLEFQVVINVQGDEPDVAVADLEQLIAAFDDSEVDVATLCVTIESDAEWRDPSVVKVVRDSKGDALYFSRSPIPSNDHARPSDGQHREHGQHGEQLRPPAPRLRHVGVYAFRPAALKKFCALPEGQLEAQENLEQLRWLESGGRLRVLTASHAPRGIDTRDDYEEFVARTAARARQ